MADARVAVVGGGIAGLATAWYLQKRANANVILVEANDRLGGKIRTRELAGVPVEAGPDTFLARVPWATDLCRDLGLAEKLEAPATGRAFVLARGRLRPIPEGLVLGVPTAPASLLRSGVLSPAGAARAALDVALPRSRWSDDPSVADVVRSRLGREVLDVLVDPLVGGINAGRADRLSLRSTAPQLAAGVDAHRSLVFGLRRQLRAGVGSDGPVFLGLRGGLERLVHRLRASLPATQVRLGTRVATLAPLAGQGYRLSCAPGPDVVADAVVLAVPAFGAADLLRPWSPEAADDLAAIEYASVVVATLGYRRGALQHPLDGSGFLVPRRAGWLTTACTWSTSKWPALKESGLTLLRASAGRIGDERALALDDETLVRRLHDELSRAVGLSQPPTATLVSRWTRSFPQYQPGHARRVDRIEAALDKLPGVFVTGAAYRGLGIAACIREADATAARVAAILHRSASSS